MSKLDAVTLGLLVVGGANWGLVALAEFDLVATLLGMEFGETIWRAGWFTGWSGCPRSGRRCACLPSPAPARPDPTAAHS